VSAASNELIASLKAELASQKELARDGARFKKEWEASEERANALEIRAASLVTSLAEAKAELKTISAKLTAARAAEVAATAKVPGSALKAGTVESATQASQMKEDLYADLTGLIVRAVQRGAEQDVYDCIQTGRNGSKLFSHRCNRRHGDDS
jgi:chromosome segregation ATPase